MTFTPKRDSQTARVRAEPDLADVATAGHRAVVAGECGDWITRPARPTSSHPDPGGLRGQLPGGVRREGVVGWRCRPARRRGPRGGRRVAPRWAASCAARRDGPVPAGLKPAFEVGSAPLAEVIRDINKYSNNVMAQQVVPHARPAAEERGSLEGARDRCANGGTSASAPAKASR